jgi:Family of unknown function (DUF6221)
MMVTMTLTEFLMARIAEDEAVARAVTPGPWWIEKTSSHMDTETWAVADIERFRGYTNHVSVGEDKPLAEYIARHDPARVLAECEAKREIIKAADEVGRGTGWITTQTFLQLLALPYADHPDYQQEWRP